MMLESRTALPSASAALGRPQRPSPCPAAPCRPTAARPAGLCPSCPAGAVPAPGRRRRLAVRVSAQGGGGSDLESQDLESQSFHSLAKVVASKLASEVAGQEGAFNRMKLW